MPIPFVICRLLLTASPGAKYDEKFGLAYRSDWVYPPEMANLQGQALSPAKLFFAVPRERCGGSYHLDR